MSTPPGARNVMAPGAERELRRLFLTLFLRGRTSRGLRKEQAPGSIGSKLALTLFIYALVGLVALTFRGQPLFSLALYLHAMTLVFVGMTIASSAGEVLFNKEEGDILLHRPVTSEALLRARIGVLVQASLWLAGAFNIAGFIAGIFAPDGGWMFLLAHTLSTALQALFCTACVVLAYELCLRWLGRERLDGIMTTVQVLMAVCIVAAGQIAPQLIGRSGLNLTFSRESWWIGLLPPAWFAGFDQALCGRGGAGAWALAFIGLVATFVAAWLAFHKLAHYYGKGLQTLGEAAAAPPPGAGTGPGGARRWLVRLVEWPALRWWLREPVTRASFLLTAAYLLRDREMKLRVYPSIAPMLMMPLIFLFQGRGESGGIASAIGVAFSGGYVGFVALLGLSLLQFSQQWPASEVFRLAPMHGPGRICDGARRAVLFFLALPVVAAFGLLSWCLRDSTAQLPLLIPGLISLPIFAVYPHLGGRAVPLSVPGEDAKSAGRGLQMMAVTLISMALSAVSAWSWATGWFWPFVIAEALLALALYALMRASVTKARWRPIDS